MLRLRDRGARGRTHGAFVESRHTFSFGGYNDPANMGFRSLRVINEDWIVPGAGFPPHRHEDMEILTYVVSGTVEHKDSLGNTAQISAGEVQRMSAGRGIEHSELNPSRSERAHLLQIWILPAVLGLEPAYEQKAFAPAKAGELRLIAGQTPGDGALLVHQDVQIYRAIIAPGEALTAPFRADRHGWIQVVDGIVELDAGELRPGDGLAVSEVQDLRLRSPHVGAELLIFDLA